MTRRQGNHIFGKAALVAVALALGAIAAAPASAATTPTPGKVTFMLNAKSEFDDYVTEASAATRAFASSHYWRVRAYPPFFDKALDWAPPTYFYKDLYAIYNPSENDLIQQHPDWVLRDAEGEPLYIDWDCDDGSCPQYAADIGNPSWRRHWIEEAGRDLAKGYIGIHIDDVNMEMRVSDGDDDARPIDARTGRPMTDESWRRYTAEFVEEVRRAFPNAWISHNGHWWIDHSDPYHQRQIDAADAIELERSFSDAGLTGGGGTFGFETFLSHIDWLHARGKSVIFQPYDLDTVVEREFELASYFLVQEGEDAITTDDGAYPDGWWSGWSTDLGAPQGRRYEWDGLLRRDFANGFVIVNEPDAESRTIGFDRSFHRIDGSETAEVTLDEREGAVLLGTPPPVEAREAVSTSTRIKGRARRNRVKLRGVVRRADEGRVEITVESREGNGWTPFRSLRSRLQDDGDYRKRLRHLPPDRYRISARYLGSEEAQPSESDPRKLRIKR